MIGWIAVSIWIYFMMIGLLISYYDRYLRKPLLWIVSVMFILFSAALIWNDLLGKRGW